MGSISDGPPGAAPCWYEILRVQDDEQIRDEPAFAMKTKLTSSRWPLSKSGDGQKLLFSDQHGTVFTCFMLETPENMSCCPRMKIGRSPKVVFSLRQGSRTKSTSGPRVTCPICITVTCVRALQERSNSGLISKVQITKQKNREEGMNPQLSP